jgi:hypothetical protein
MAIVVVITPNTTHAIAGSGHRGFVGHISERTITVVVVERIASGDAAIVKVTAVDEVNINPTISVEVGNANTGPKFLAIDRNSVCTFVVREPDTSLGSNVNELNGPLLLR